jgi:UDPglucose 6-dehydrogenase
MRVTVVGTGYVGLVTGACLSDMGNDVVCVDKDAGKVARLDRGEIPIHEPGLDGVVARNVEAGRLSFTTDIDKAVDHGQLIFIAVGTPPGEDGSADLSHALAAARSIGRRMSSDKIVVNKSTVPVGTGERVRATVQAELDARGVKHHVTVVSNPEFLKEGAAVADFMRPDRIVIGSDDERAIRTMRTLYAPYVRNHDRILVMDVKSAELTKYAANAMLATRISFMNDLALLAEEVGADIEQVRIGIGADGRIGTSFLYAGAGYGGSCFPKDVKALIRTGQQNGHELELLRAVESINDRQKHELGRRVVARLGDDLAGKRIAVWGLAFKPNTDDMREAPSLVLIEELLRRGAQVVAYDPVAVDEARRLLGDRPGVTYAARAMDALEAADALAIVTEWKEFRSPDFERMKAVMRQPLVFDGRNLYDPVAVREAGLEYRAIGR